MLIEISYRCQLVDGWRVERPIISKISLSSRSEAAIADGGSAV
jgi:hypothetical protein